LNNPGRAFYVREITRKIDEQINSVRRELANMLSIGIIKSETSNNRLYYEINQDYVHFEPLHQIFAADEISSVAGVADANDWTKRLKPLGDVKVALLAGQLVHTSKAEVDILIAGSLNKAQVKKFIKELEEEENKALNYAVMTYEDFYYRLSVKDRFIAQLLTAKHTVLADQEGILR
jgi:hypothetical protein